MCVDYLYCSRPFLCFLLCRKVCSFRKQVSSCGLTSSCPFFQNQQQQWGADHQQPPQREGRLRSGQVHSGGAVSHLQHPEHSRVLSGYHPAGERPAPLRSPATSGSLVGLSEANSPYSQRLPRQPSYRGNRASFHPHISYQTGMTS